MPDASVLQCSHKREPRLSPPHPPETMARVFTQHFSIEVAGSFTSTEMDFDKAFDAWVSQLTVEEIRDKIVGAVSPTQLLRNVEPTGVDDLGECDCR